MVSHNLAPASDEDVAIDDLLYQFDAYIVALVSKNIYGIANPEVLDLEIDEIAQRVRIKLWLALRRKRINNPTAYIKRIVQSELVNMIRQRKPTLPLPVNEEGELYTGTVTIMSNEDMVDPANELEQEEAVTTLLASAVKAVSSLPPRQRLAMISSLAERVDDVFQLVGAFKKHHIDVVVDCPEDELDRLRLKASLSVARKKVGQYMGIKQSGHDVADRVPVVQRRETFPADGNEPLAPDRRNGESQEEATKGGEGMEAYIGKLCEPYQTAVRLHYVNKHTRQQIANELNLPIGTVKSHINRGMKRLRKLLEQKDVEHAPNGGSEIGHGTDIAEIATRVKTLDEPYRTAVELHYVKKHTCQQIANELSLPKGTVKSHISRGMKRLHRSV